MPLLVDKVQICDLHIIKSTNMFYERYPKIKEHSRRSMLNLKLLLFDKKMPALYVMQHEYAIVAPYDEHIRMIFTDNMTTCVAGILRNRRNRMICLCHFDRINLRNDLSTFDQICRQMSSSNDTSSSNMLEQDCNDEFDLMLIGGYLDERNISDQLVLDILCMFNLIKYDIHLELIYVGKLNTKMITRRQLSSSDKNSANNKSSKSKKKKNYIVEVAKPKETGISVGVRNGEFLGAILARKSKNKSMDSIQIPLYKLRQMFISFRSSSMSEYLSIYDYHEQLLRIPPLKLDRCYFTASAKQYFEETLKFNDKEILNHFSTSPTFEPEHFVHEMREVLKFFYDHLCTYGFDSANVILSHYFPNGQPRCFRLVTEKNIQLDLGYLYEKESPSSHNNYDESTSPLGLSNTTDHSDDDDDDDAHDYSIC